MVLAAAAWARRWWPRSSAGPATRTRPNVHLWVTETNTRARTLYERCGFALTGEQQPLPSDPILGEVAMSRTLP